MIETSAYRRTLDPAFEGTRLALLRARENTTDAEELDRLNTAIMELPDDWVPRYANADDEKAENAQFATGIGGEVIVDRRCKKCGQLEPCECEAPQYEEIPRVLSPGHAHEVPVRVTLDDPSNQGFPEALVEIEQAPDVVRWARETLDALEVGKPVELGPDDAGILRRILAPTCVSAGWNGNLRRALGPAFAWGKRDPGASDDLARDQEV